MAIIIKSSLQDFIHAKPTSAQTPNSSTSSGSSLIWPVLGTAAGVVLCCGVAYLSKKVLSGWRSVEEKASIDARCDRSKQRETAAPEPGPPTTTGSPAATASDPAVPKAQVPSVPTTSSTAAHPEEQFDRPSSTALRRSDALAMEAKPKASTVKPVVVGPLEAIVSCVAAKVPANDAPLITGDVTGELVTGELAAMLAGEDPIGAAMMSAASMAEETTVMRAPSICEETPKPSARTLPTTSEIMAARSSTAIRTNLMAATTVAVGAASPAAAQDLSDKQASAPAVAAPPLKLESSSEGGMPAQGSTIPVDPAAMVVVTAPSALSASAALVAPAVTVAPVAIVAPAQSLFVGTVLSVFTFPFAGCSGLPVRKLDLQAGGFPACGHPAYDFRIVSASGALIGAAKHRAALSSLRLSAVIGGNIFVSNGDNHGAVFYPRMREVRGRFTVFSRVTNGGRVFDAVDQGDDVSAVFAHVIGMTGARLVHLITDIQQDPAYRELRIVAAPRDQLSGTSEEVRRQLEVEHRPHALVAADNMEQMVILKPGDLLTVGHAALRVHSCELFLPRATILAVPPIAVICATIENNRIGVLSTGDNVIISSPQ